MHSARYTASQNWFERAHRVIPGGIHLSGRPLVGPEDSPLYFERGQGCRIWDADGHEYVDYLMAFGACLLGYAEPEVERAAAEQARRGRLLSMNHPVHVQFVETLLTRFPFAQMGVFFRTGSEATTAALRIARKATGRRVVARSGYHGWHDWCLPLEAFVPAGLDQQVAEFAASRPETLAELFRERGSEIAAVILAPEMVLPHDPAVFREIARLCAANGALFILDEVKTALRIAPNSVAERVGVVPDLLTVSKALGNGFAVAAVVGRREVMQVAAGMHYSATYHGDTAAMAAALKTLELLEARGVAQHVESLGTLLIDGLNQLAARHSLPARAFPEPLPAMPFFRFEHPDARRNAALTTAFYREVLARGFLLHPRHLWFLSASHTRGDVERTLEAADAALAVAATTLG